MAGIGFELRKIYGKKTLASNIWGTIYATTTTVGPSMLFACLVLVLKLGMDAAHLPQREGQFFMASFTYIFLAAILVSALFNTAVSRYLSDCIFMDRQEDLASAVYGVLTASAVTGGVLSLVLCIALRLHDGLPLRFLVPYYTLGVLAACAYNMITFVSALKQYMMVTLSYFLGLVAGVAAFFLLYRRMELVLAAYVALDLAFFLINFLMIFLCLRAFGKPNENYFAFLTYFRRHPRLILSGLCYMLGFYITSVIYWFFSDMSVPISIFRTAPVYDTAMFLAITVNMPALVVFVVRSETSFYEQYVSYLSALNKGSYDQIERERESIICVIRDQLFFIYEFQLILILILIFLINVLFPYLGISMQVLNLFMVLAMSLYCVFCMYFTVIFLYYFDDQTGSCIGPVIFLAVSTLLAGLFCILGRPWYPLALFFGGILGWIAAFVRLKNLLLRLNTFLMCK